MKVLLLESAVFSVATVVRLMWLYLALPMLTPITWIVRYGYMLVLLVHLALILTYIGVFLSWLILAAALEPTRFLPYGVAVVAVAVVGTLVTKQMAQAAKKLRDELLRAFRVRHPPKHPIARALNQPLPSIPFQAMMQSKLRKAIRTIGETIRAKQREERRVASEERRRKRNEAMRLEPCEIDGDEPAAGSPPAAEEEEEESEDEEAPLMEDDKEITPAEVFAAMNMDGDDTISMEEFRRFFELLEASLTPNQLEQLFAFCDADCSGSISEAEFVKGYATRVCTTLPSPFLCTARALTPPAVHAQV